MQIWYGGSLGSPINLDGQTTPASPTQELNPLQKLLKVSFGIGSHSLVGFYATNLRGNQLHFCQNRSALFLAAECPVIVKVYDTSWYIPTHENRACDGVVIDENNLVSS